MAILPPPAPARLGDSLTRVMSRIDGCPNCAHNTEAPTAALPQGASWVCHYRCSDCGTTWSTSWLED